LKKLDYAALREIKKIRQTASCHVRFRVKSTWWRWWAKNRPMQFRLLETTQMLNGIL